MEASTSIDKALDLLFHLHGAGGPLGVSQASRDLGLPKASVHRLLRTLTRRGLVERDDGGRYRPGAGLIALGLGVLERDPVVAVAHPVVESEARELGETTFLTGMRGGEMVVLDKAEGSGFLRAAPRVGAAVPLHATAVGKLAIAYEAAPPAPEGSPAYTAWTNPGGAALREATAAARRRGYAVNRDEWIEGLSVVAAPVLSPDGRFLAALAIAAPTPRMESLGVDVVAARAMAAAARIRRRLAGTAEGDLR